MSNSDNSSDSEYVVEYHVKPDTVRITQVLDDLISGSDDEDKSEKSASDSEEKPVNEQCVLNQNHENEEEEDNSRPDRREGPARTNSRYILYVTNLSATSTKTMLLDFFGDAGEVKSVRMPRVRLGNFAFVEMKELEGYRVSITYEIKYSFKKRLIPFKAGLKFNNKLLDDRKIQVYPGSKNKKHTSDTAKNLKRKNQQKHLNNIKMRKTTKEINN